MLIIYDVKNEKVISSMGTNALYPDGEIPNLRELENDQIYIKLHDNSEMAREIMTLSEFNLTLDSEFKVTSVIPIKSLKEVREETHVLDKLKPSEKDIMTAERQVNLINDLTELGVI